MSDNVATSDLTAVHTTEQLAERLRQLHQKAEGPSLRELAEWGIHRNRPLPKSSTQDVLQGVRPPSGHLLRNFLAACRVAESDVQPWLDALERVQAGRPAPRQRSKSEQELGQVAATRFFVEQDDLIEIARLINTAQDEVWLWGTTLSMHIPYLATPYVERALARGVRVKILLIKPDSAAMAMSAMRAGPGNDQEGMEERLSINLGILPRIAERGPGLDVRLIDYLAPYTLYAYDPGLAQGQMDLRLGSFHGKHELRPTFHLHRERDGEWVDYFYEQFVLVWNAAIPAARDNGEPGRA